MMCIALRHQIRLMPEQPLNLVEIHPALNQPRGEAVSHVVKPEIWNSGPITRLTKLPHEKSNLQEIAEWGLEDWPT